MAGGGMLPPIPCMFDGVRYSPLIRVRQLPPEPYEKNLHAKVMQIHRLLPLLFLNKALSVERFGVISVVDNICKSVVLVWKRINGIASSIRTDPSKVYGKLAALIFLCFSPLGWEEKKQY